MANEKSNNVRILQSTQKNNLPPIAHAAIGFLVGAALIIVTGLGYFYLSSDDSSNNEPRSVHQDQKPESGQAIQAKNQVSQDMDVLAHQSSNVTSTNLDNEDSKEFDNIYSKEIGTAFNHGHSETVASSNLSQQNTSSPFNLEQPKPQTVQQKPTVIKNPTATTATKTPVKPTQSVTVHTTKPATVKPAPAVEESYEEPMGGTQISETKRPKVSSATNVSTSATP